MRFIIIKERIDDLTVRSRAVLAVSCLEFRHNKANYNYKKWGKQATLTLDFANPNAIYTASIAAALARL